MKLKADPNGWPIWIKTTKMENRKLPAGCRVRYFLEDGMEREGTLAKTVMGLGYSIITASGTRKLVPHEKVHAWPR